MFTTIVHPLRKINDLSIIEYCVLEEVRVLSHSNNKSGGWCDDPETIIPETLDLKYSIFLKTLNSLKKKGLIYRNHLGAVQCTDYWLKSILNFI